MRKIIMTQNLDPNNFEIIHKVVEKDQDQIKVIFEGARPLLPDPKYTIEEQKRIDACNSILEDEGLPLLTEEEVEYFLDPAGVNKKLFELSEKMKDTETLQELAGFSVEKTIRPT